MDRSLAAARQRVHHHGAQEREQRRTVAIGVAVGVLTELGVLGSVPLVLHAPALAGQP